MNLPFRRQKSTDLVPTEIKEYYAHEERDKNRASWLLGAGVFVATVIIVLAVFYGGRALYRVVFEDDNATTTEQTSDSANTTNETAPTTDDKSSTGSATDEGSTSSSSQPSDTPTTDNSTSSTETTPSTGPTEEEIPRTGPLLDL